MSYLGILLVLLITALPSSAASSSAASAPEASAEGALPSRATSPSQEALPAQPATQPARTFGIRNASVPEDGLLFGGQPSEEQLRAVVAAGYSVIDLRADSEDRGFDEPALLEALSARYTAIPVSAQTLQSAAPIEAFLRVMGELERPALIHCASSNRVGALYYAYLVKRQGVDRAEALERARKGGLSSDELRAVVDRWLDLP